MSKHPSSSRVAENRNTERRLGFYVEMVFVALGLAAVVAWLGALVYVIVT